MIRMVPIRFGDAAAAAATAATAAAPPSTTEPDYWDQTTTGYIDR